MGQSPEVREVQASTTGQPPENQIKQKPLKIKSDLSCCIINLNQKYKIMMPNRKGFLDILKIKFKKNCESEI